MRNNITWKASAPVTVLSLLLVFLWLHTPSQRLRAIERNGKSSFLYTHRIVEPSTFGVCGNGLEGEVDSIGEALKIAEENPTPDIQRRVVHLSLRLASQDFLIISFPRQAFDEQAEQMIHGLAMVNDPDPNHVLLAGLVEDKAAVPHLQRLAADTTSDKAKAPPLYSNSWAASLALARMGDKQATKACVKRLLSELKKHPSAFERLQIDGVTYLDYIRQPESIEALKQVLVAKQPVFKQTNTSTEAQRNYRFHQQQFKAYMSLLKSLKDAPQPPDKDRIFMGRDTEKLRTWMESQKRLVIKR